MAKWCAACVTVKRQQELAGEHLTEVITGVPHGLLHLSDRFAGKLAPSSLRNVRAGQEGDFGARSGPGWSPAAPRAV